MSWGCLGWLAAAAAVSAVLFGDRQAGCNAERVETMRRTVECNVTSSRLRAVVLAIAASLRRMHATAGAKTARRVTDGKREKRH